MWNHNYFVYIITNYSKTVLYTGVTNDLGRRLEEHKTGLAGGFTSKYACHYLLYFERFSSIGFAIEREKEIKKWSRKKKEDLIKELNPAFDFLNSKVKTD